MTQRLLIDKGPINNIVEPLYQLLFYNKLWETQKFGGFDAGKDGPYGVFYHGNIDKKGEVIEDAAKKLKFLLEQSIEDVDVLTGWNSEGFDIPYIVNRIARQLGKDYTRKLCHWGQFPKKRNYEHYGNTQEEGVVVGKTGVA
mgnify:CR=1 FL=1